MIGSISCINSIRAARPLPWFPSLGANMDNFESALKVVLNHEGGFTNDPMDPGGPTNLGLTMRDWLSYYGTHGTIDDIKALTPRTAAPIYKKLYWDAMGLDNIKSYPLALVIFDQGVLSGIYFALGQIQILAGVKVDHKMGTLTIDAIERIDNKKLTLQFLRACMQHYIRIGQPRFLEGWLNRIFSLIQEIF